MPTNRTEQIRISFSFKALYNDGGKMYRFTHSRRRRPHKPSAQGGTAQMSGKMFIERREQEGDYAIRRPDAARISDHKSTQAKAIERAREIDPKAAILVERVRNTNKGHRDKLRKP